MNAERIRKIRDRKEKARYNNFMNYQESGDSRYYTRMNAYEDLVEICDQALSAAEDHEKRVVLTSHLSQLAEKAAQALYKKDEAAYETICKDIVAVASMSVGFVNRYQ